MISERQVAKSFYDLWSSATPLLRPNFVAVFNTAYCKSLTDNTGKTISELNNLNGNNPTIVAELGFVIASAQFKKNISNSEIRKHTTIVENCVSRASARIANFLEISRSEIEISKSEISEALDIALRYELLLGQSNSSIVFSPIIPGSGIVDSCEADIASDDCLWEVKSVRRNISGNDIRQLLVYLALSHGNRESSWNYAGIFNPRMSTFYKFEIEHLISFLSGGKSAGEVFHEILSYFEMREIQIDATF